MDKINNLSVEYIVESGTSGVWNYRKWNSGRAELWFGKASTSTFGGSPTQSQSGNLYQEVYTFNNAAAKFPFPLTSVGLCQLQSASADTHCIVQNAGFDNNGITGFVGFRGTAGAYPCHINCYVTGLWK